MTEDKSLKPCKKSCVDDLNVIIADTRWETFEQLSDPGDGINLLNLSSDFAVDFIIDYERIDMILISRRISRLDEITRKARKKKITIFIMGEDIAYPLDRKQVIQLLENERFSRSEMRNSKRRAGPGSYIKKILGLDSEKRLLKHACNDSKSPVIEEKQPSKSGKEKPRNGLKKKKIIRQKTADDYEEIYQNESNGKKSDEPETDKDYESMFWGEKEPGVSKNTSSVAGSDISSYQSRETGHFAAKRNRDSSFQNFIAIKQKIIVFLKAKGGVGSTLLSLFLAYHFRKLKTLLVDLNFCEGGSDIGYYLNIPKSPNMIVFIEGYNRNAMDNAVVKINENLDVLQAPPTYEMSKKMDLQDIYSMVDIARKKYHLIIFDLPNQINDIYLGVLDIADLALMVSDYTIGSIGRLVSINKRFIYDDLEKMLILNRNRNGNGASFMNRYVAEFFSSEEVLTLKENAHLNRKIDFCDFDFSGIKEFSILGDRILERLKCE